MPHALAENEEAEFIYFTVQDQYIMAPMGGPVALNQNAIHEAMRLYRVSDPKDCFEKVVKLYRKIIAKQINKTGNEGQGN